MHTIVYILALGFFCGEGTLATYAENDRIEFGAGTLEGGRDLDDEDEDEDDGPEPPGFFAM